MLICTLRPQFYIDFMKEDPYDLPLPDEVKMCHDFNCKIRVSAKAEQQIPAAKLDECSYTDQKGLTY